MGEGESDTTERPFHIMKAVERTSAKLRICAASCRGCMSARPSMVADVVCSCWFGGVVGACLLGGEVLCGRKRCCEFEVDKVDSECEVWCTCTTWYMR